MIFRTSAVTVSCTNASSDCALTVFRPPERGLLLAAFGELRLLAAALPRPALPVLSPAFERRFMALPSP
jgi:hypothetical protein